MKNTQASEALVYGRTADRAGDKVTVYRHQFGAYTLTLVRFTVSSLHAIGLAGDPTKETIRTAAGSFGEEF